MQLFFILLNVVYPWGFLVMWRTRQSSVMIITDIAVVTGPINQNHWKICLCTWLDVTGLRTGRLIGCGLYVGVYTHQDTSGYHPSHLQWPSSPSPLISSSSSEWITFIVCVSVCGLLCILMVALHRTYSFQIPPAFFFCQAGIHRRHELVQVEENSVGITGVYSKHCVWGKSARISYRTCTHQSIFGSGKSQWGCVSVRGWLGLQSSSCRSYMDVTPPHTQSMLMELLRPKVAGCVDFLAQTIKELLQQSLWETCVAGAEDFLWRGVW